MHKRVSLDGLARDLPEGSGLLKLLSSSRLHFHFLQAHQDIGSEYLPEASTITRPRLTPDNQNSLHRFLISIYSTSKRIHLPLLTSKASSI